MEILNNHQTFDLRVIPFRTHCVRYLYPHNAVSRASISAKMIKARAYQSITPANNMILQKKWDQSRFNMHRMKVHDAKPIIDNKPPEIYLHLHLKYKKRQVEEERNAIIRKENRLLLEKMSIIIRSKGRLDNTNYYRKRSLNKTQRQCDFLRVTHENQAILQRIQSKEPCYNHRQWLDQWKMNKGYRDKISRYQHTWTNKEQQEQGKRKEKCTRKMTPTKPLKDMV